MWKMGDDFVMEAVWESAKWRKGAFGTGKQVSQEDKDLWDVFVKHHFRRVSATKIKNCTSQMEMESRMVEVICRNGERIKK